MRLFSRIYQSTYKYVIKQDVHMTEDRHFMQLAIECACNGIRHGGGPFGAIIVNKSNVVIGMGHNKVVNSKDPTAHAEIVCIRDACNNTNSHILNDCILYTTCEPCSMCLSAIYWARIRKVVYGNTREDAKDIGFDDNHIYDEVAKPICERTLDMTQSSRNETIITFEQWKQKQDKIHY